MDTDTRWERILREWREFSRIQKWGASIREIGVEAVGASWSPSLSDIAKPFVQMNMDGRAAHLELGTLLGEISINISRR